MGTEGIPKSGTSKTSHGDESTASDLHAGSSEETKNPDPVQRFARALLIAIAVLFLWYVAADRVAPWTDQARVQSWVIPVSPKVSGKVVKVAVEKDQVVKAGDILVKIDPEKYELAVIRAEAALQIAGQSVGAATAQISTAQARLVESTAKFNESEVQLARIESVEKKGVVTPAFADSARADRDKARAQMNQSEAELQKAKEELGLEGEENPRIREALATLKQARIDLKDTVIFAPTDGGITNLKIDKGYYAKAGVPLMTFVAFDDVWIQANLRENNAGNIQVGDPVEIVLDMLPGRVLKGTVSSRGFAIKQPSYGAAGEAVTVKAHSGWLRDAQRFPVSINFDDESAEGYRFVGGQADVQIYTQNSNWLLNGLGWVWIRLMSLLSYVY
ncbi:MAG: biotin/lipoyl-binding protein [Desulfuromusa sp.]|nr:biotin/lipoyl-binding protein [Desulfuromusa sp.]